LYTNSSISEKSPLWKVFSSHIHVGYIIGYNDILEIPQGPHDPSIRKSVVWRPS